jgi:hypothetical protein
MPAGTTAVYVGTLHDDRIDVPLVVELARELPHVSLLFVGPNLLSDEHRALLRQSTNVLLCGARPYDDVPAYLQHADVVIVPHVVSPFTESLDPIKAYECLAVGRPTVATGVPGFRGQPPPVRAVDRAQFVAAVKNALSSRDYDQPSESISLPTWRERGVEFAAALARARLRRSTPCS